MTSIGSPSPFFLAGEKAYEVERSLRFNSGDNTYLARTPSSTTSRTTWTYSTWIKKTSFGSTVGLFGTSGSDNNTMTELLFTSSNKFSWQAYNKVYFQTNQVFRDPSAWFHLLVRCDTTNSTQADRIQLWINGSRVTSFATENLTGSGTEFGINRNVDHRIGERPGGSNNFNGYLAEMHFVDGTALDSSSFVKTDAITGQIVPKKYVGSYGTNGFYLNFLDNSGTTATTLGKDSSGNGNNFTPNNFSVAANLANDSMPDTPTNNFCTLNPLNATSSFNFGTNEGNLVFDQSSNDQAITGTFFITSGKWYWEIYKNSGQNPEIGICGQEFLSNQSTGAVNRLAFITNGGDLRTGSSSTTSITGGSAQTGAGWIRIAVDMDNKKIWFSDTSGNYFNSGNPATGANAAYDFSSHSVADGWTPYVGMFTGSGHNCYMNFGQFELNSFSSNIPAGFKTLCTANLPDPVIKIPNKVFDILLYTGTDSAANRTLTGLNFSPDWVWQKRRNGTNWHGLHDTVRGGGKTIYSNSSNAEATNNQYGYLSSFNSDGFTWSAGSTNNSDGNETGGTFVSWCWDAGETDGKTYTVKVHNFSGNNRYIFDDFQTQAVTLDLAEGGTYIFNMDDASNASHPFSIGTAANGTVYTSGITYFLDGVSKTYSQYTSGFAGATTRRLHITVPASAPVLYYWCSVHSGMGGQINTNSTLGSSNFGGSIVSVAKTNSSVGFSIVKYAGTGSAGATVGHGLGVAPNVIILKNRTDSSSAQWTVYHSAAFNSASDPNILYLNTTNAEADDTNVFGTSVTIDSNKFSLGDYNGSNGSGDNMIAYCFSSVAGYSKFGSYTPNQNDNGPFIYTGFRPRWIMIKSRGNIYGGGSPFSGNWYILDTSRDTFNVATTTLAPSQNYADDSAWGTDGIMDILSNGFKIRTDQLAINATLAYSFVYFAFAESPFKYARAR